MRVHIAPDGHAWRDRVAEAVERGGGAAVAREDAEALVWVASAREVAELPGFLHDGIRWVQLRSAGVDGFLRDGIIDPDRIWTSARGAYGPVVAEHAMALLLAATKRLHEHATSRTWGAVDKASMGLLADSRVVVVGVGGIGSEVVRLASLFGSHVTAVTRDGRSVPSAETSVNPDGLLAVLPGADHVVLALPSTPRTRHLIDRSALAAMEQHAWIINVGRGETVDTEALVVALQNGRIGGAALDVSDPEPLPDTHPLWSLPNVLLTSHTANVTGGQLAAFCRLVEENVRRSREGRPLLAVVSVERGY